MLKIEFLDYIHLMVIYIVLVLVRGAFTFASRPLLKRLSADRQEVSYADCAVMTWGGLRGAVGLALAIQVHNDRAPSVIESRLGEPQIDQQTGLRILFFVGGIALLTTIINA